MYSTKEEQKRGEQEEEEEEEKTKKRSGVEKRVASLTFRGEVEEKNHEEEEEEDFKDDCEDEDADGAEKILLLTPDQFTKDNLLENTNNKNATSAASLSTSPSSVPPSGIGGGGSKKKSTYLMMRRNSLIYANEDTIKFVDTMGQEQTVKLATVAPLKTSGTRYVNPDDEVLCSIDLSCRRRLKRRQHIGGVALEGGEGNPGVIVLDDDDDDYLTFRLTTKTVTLCGMMLGVIATALVLIYTVFPPTNHTTREFYLGIDEVQWDYLAAEGGGGGVNNCTGDVFGYPEDKWISKGNADAPRIGSVYTKAMYRRYVDDTFRTLWTDDDEGGETTAGRWDHLGLVGPALHVQVGDLVKITLRNNARFPFSLSMAGSSTNKANEGAAYFQGGRARPRWWSYDDAVRPLSLGIRDCGTPDSFMTWSLPTTAQARAGQRSHNKVDSLNEQDKCRNFEVGPAEARTYEFLVDEASGPGPNDPSTVMRLYTSHVGGKGIVDRGDAGRETGFAGYGEDVSAGLIGPLIVARKDLASIDPPPDVDREVVVVMAAFDENESPYLRDNIFARVTKPYLDLDNRPPGHVPFGPTGKVRALQKLYANANGVGDKLSHVDAEGLIANANAAKTYVDEVRGIRVHVWFDDDFFDPRWYDSRYGGTGTALALLEGMWKELVDVGDPSFRESNMMHAVNGYVYCAMPTLQFETDEIVRWHTASVGGAPDGVHTPHWHGHTVVVPDGGRNDQVDLLAGNTLTVDMLAENEGRWMLHCHVNDHKKAGMISFYDVVSSNATEASTRGVTDPTAPVCEMDPQGVTREYYIQAEEVEWTYYDETLAASDGDKCSEVDASSSLSYTSIGSSTGLRAVESNGIDRIGVNFTKAVYVQYTDGTYTTRVIKDPHMGILGPAIRAVVGDKIHVHFKNTLVDYNVSVHAHGVQYGKSAEGAPYADGTTAGTSYKDDDVVAPGQTHTYEWCVPSSAGPAQDTDASSIVWLYHDHVHEINGTNAGLVGPIVISKRDASVVNVTTAEPTDVDKEFFLLFASINENAALFAERNVADRLPQFEGNNASLSATEQESLTTKLRLYDSKFRDSMRKRSINGYLRCNLPGLVWSVDDTVRLHTIAIGDEETYAPALTGHSFLHRGKRVASVGLMASTMKTVDLSSSLFAGNYLLTSGTSDSSDRGMLAMATVTAPPNVAAEDEDPSNVKRTYYVAADEVEWDFLPYGANMCAAGASPAAASTSHDEMLRDGGVAALGPSGYNGWSDPANGLESEFSLKTNADVTQHRIGTKYVIALFREYTSSSFSKLLSGARSRANPVSRHLGMQGPVLRARPGDKIAVVLRNNLRYEMNFVIKGARPVGGSKAERPLAPGETRRVVYNFATTTFGSTNVDDSFAISYSSDREAAVAGQAASGNVVPVSSTFADFRSGLFGAVVVTQRGETLGDGAPDDTNREFVLFMSALDLNKSPYIDLNIRQFTGSPETVDKSDPEFKESNVMNHVNGRSYCNLEGLHVLQGRESRWYIFAVGNDVATPRWYGHAVSVDGHHVGAAMVLPGTSVVANVKHDARGTWLVSDQTSSHAHGGASALFSTIERVTVSCKRAFWATC
eukprot:g4601.t1